MIGAELAARVADEVERGRRPSSPRSPTAAATPSPTDVADMVATTVADRASESATAVADRIAGRRLGPIQTRERVRLQPAFVWLLWLLLRALLLIALDGTTEAPLPLGLRGRAHRQVLRLRRRAPGGAHAAVRIVFSVLDFAGGWFDVLGRPFCVAEAPRCNRDSASARCYCQYGGAGNAVDQVREILYRMRSCTISPPTEQGGKKRFSELCHGGQPVVSQRVSLVLCESLACANDAARRVKEIAAEAVRAHQVALAQRLLEAYRGARRLGCRQRRAPPGVEYSAAGQPRAPYRSPAGHVLLPPLPTERA